MKNEINWNNLTHAYGEATDIPALLSEAETAAAPYEYTDDPWYTLWSFLCHQGNVYPASFASADTLIRIAESRQGAVARECLFLVASIEIGRHSVSAPELPENLAEAYRQALAKGEELAREFLEVSVDPEDKRLFLGAVEAFSGDIDSAREILDPEEE